MYCELQFTSAPRGLLSGASGYCTVKATAGIPNSLRTALEGLSHYRHVFAPGDANAALNPVAWSHTILNAAGQQWHVLSRTQASGVDHTRRSNNFSHHLAIPGDGLPNAGPAWLVSQRVVLQTAWDQAVGELPTQNRLPSGRESMSVCRHWEAATGDAGWGGAVAAHLVNMSAPVVIVFQLGQDVLPLFRESLALLPERQRWAVTFSTFFTGQSASYRLRGVLAGSPELAQLRRLPQALILDLTTQLGVAPEGDYTEAARTGSRRRAGVSSQPRRVEEKNSARETRNDWLSVPGKSALNGTSPAKIPTAPPRSTSSIRPEAPKAAVPTLWLACGGLAAFCVLMTCLVLGVKWSLPSPRTMPNPAHQIVEDNPKDVVDVAKALAGKQDGAGSVEAVTSDRTVENPKDHSSPKVAGRRIFVEPFDEDVGQVEVERRSDINDYVGHIRRKPKEIHIPDSQWPKAAPWEIEFVGIPAACRVERVQGVSGLSDRWRLHDETTQNILEVYENSPPQPEGHRTLVVEFTIDDQEKISDVGLTMANVVLVLKPHKRPKYHISFRVAPRSLDQPVKLSSEQPTEIPIEDGQHWQPSLPKDTNKHPLFLRGLRLSDNSSQPQADKAVHQESADLKASLGGEWSESVRAIKLKWAPSTESKVASEDNLVLHSLRLSYLVGNVYVDLLRVDSAIVPSEGKPVRREKSNPED